MDLKELIDVLVRARDGMAVTGEGVEVVINVKPGRHAEEIEVTEDNVVWLN